MLAAEHPHEVRPVEIRLQRVARRTRKAGVADVSAPTLRVSDNVIDSELHPESVARHAAVSASVAVTAGDLRPLRRGEQTLRIQRRARRTHEHQQQRSRHQQHHHTSLTGRHSRHRRRRPQMNSAQCRRRRRRCHQHPVSPVTDTDSPATHAPPRHSPRGQRGSGRPGKPTGSGDRAGGRQQPRLIPARCDQRGDDPCSHTRPRQPRPPPPDTHIGQQRLEQTVIHQQRQKPKRPPGAVACTPVGVSDSAASTGWQTITSRASSTG